MLSLQDANVTCAICHVKQRFLEAQFVDMLLTAKNGAETLAVSRFWVVNKCS